MSGMVSVPQSCLTDRLRMKICLFLFFSLPLLPISHPKGCVSPQRVPWESGHAWLALENGRPSAQLLPGISLGARLSPGQEEGRGESGVPTAGFPVVSLCVLFYSAPKKSAWKRPGESHQRYWPTAKAWLFPVVAMGTPRSGSPFLSGWNWQGRLMRFKMAKYYSFWKGGSQRCAVHCWNTGKAISTGGILLSSFLEKLGYF